MVPWKELVTQLSQSPLLVNLTQSPCAPRWPWPLPHLQVPRTKGSSRFPDNERKWGLSSYTFTHNMTTAQTRSC